MKLKMGKNFDNCGNQDKKKLIQDCNLSDYPVFCENKNWIPKNNKDKKE